MVFVHLKHFKRLWTWYTVYADWDQDPRRRMPNWKKANINQTPHLHARMAERGGKSVFPSNLRARLSAAEDDRMRPNNGKLSESVCLLKSNIQQQCYFLPKRRTSHIKLKLVKHQSFQQSSKRIFCTFIICINAALNYRVFLGAFVV